MHRQFDITVSPEYTDELLEELQQVEYVIGMSVIRGVSIKPPGDVITLQLLNRGADEVLKLIRTGQRFGPVSIATAELASLIDPQEEDIVDRDVDEALWEEMETGLRHQGRITVNYLLLMAFGGAIAAIGAMSEPVPQVTAFVAASIIAPGFEPIAKLPLGLVLRRWKVVRRGIVSTAVGYTVLGASAALIFGLLQALDVVTVEELLGNPEVERLAHSTLLDYLVLAFGAAAGIAMIVAYRRTVIAGPLIALVLVPAAAVVGAALAAGAWETAWQVMQRLLLDALLIIGLGAVLIYLKQLTFHRRRPMA